jgi:2'-5' RNA ligase
MNSADFDRYSVVAFAPDPVGARIEVLRRLLPPSGRPIIAPHVTLKGTFVDPSNLETIAAIIRSACRLVDPVEVELGGVFDHTGSDYAAIGFHVLVPPALRALHRQLVELIGPLCTPLERGENPDEYRPHLTVVQQIPNATLANARRTVDSFDVPKRFVLDGAALMGRRRGAEWEILSSSTFSDGVSPA